MLSGVKDYQKGSIFRGGKKNDALPFVFIPPTDGRSATVSSVSGVLKVMRYGEDTYSDETIVAPLKMAEAVYADATSSAVLTIDSVATVSLSSGGDLLFANAIAPNILFRHRGGEISYETLSSPLFVRVLHTLFEIAPQSVIVITSEGMEATVEVTMGGGRVAWVDADNATTTKEISEGYHISIDGTSKNLTIQ
jgi:hypothetical protein